MPVTMKQDVKMTRPSQWKFNIKNDIDSQYGPDLVVAFVPAGADEDFDHWGLQKSLNLREYNLLRNSVKAVAMATGLQYIDWQEDGAPRFRIGLVSEAHADYLKRSPSLTEEEADQEWEKEGTGEWQGTPAQKQKVLSQVPNVKAILSQKGFILDPSMDRFYE